jgi:hypothetical protein
METWNGRGDWTLTINKGKYRYLDQHAWVDHLRLDIWGLEWCSLWFLCALYVEQTVTFGTVGCDCSRRLMEFHILEAVGEGGRVWMDIYWVNRLADRFNLSNLGIRQTISTVMTIHVYKFMFCSYVSFFKL